MVSAEGSKVSVMEIFIFTLNSTTRTLQYKCVNEGQLTWCPAGNQWRGGNWVNWRVNAPA